MNEAAGRTFELELSIDETRQPTSLAEHYIIADQFRQQGLEAHQPRAEIHRRIRKRRRLQGRHRRTGASLDDHAALARELGPYKLSLHSGSDKLSLYPILARTTNGCFHVKTAGTSYLEALRVVARHDESLFRRVIEVSRRHYDRDKATYHVSADIQQTASARRCARRR